MESSQFDRLARAVGAPRSRRAVTTLLGAMLAGPLAGPGPAAAKKKKKVTLCRNGQTITVPKKKKGSFLGKGATPGACPRGGNQPCPAGMKRCNGACIDAGDCCTTSDCDSCQREICVDGSCECPGGMFRDAGGVCSVTRSCVAIGQTTSSTQFCCSGRGAPIPNALFFCVPGNETCATDSDCLYGQHCVGNLCAGAYVGTVGEQCAEKAFDICSSRNQCATGLCEDNFCKTCSSEDQCDRGNTTSPQCFCEDGICLRRTTTPLVTACNLCPANTAHCKFVAASNKYACYPLCRAS